MIKINLGITRIWIYADVLIDILLSAMSLICSKLIPINSLRNKQRIKEKNNAGIILDVMYLNKKFLFINSTTSKKSDAVIKINVYDQITSKK